MIPTNTCYVKADSKVRNAESQVRKGYKVRKFGCPPSLYEEIIATVGVTSVCYDATQYSIHFPITPI